MLLHQESFRSVSSQCVTEQWFLQAKLMDYIACSHGYLECWSHSRVGLRGGREGKWDHLERMNESQLRSHITHTCLLVKGQLFVHLTVTWLHIWDINTHLTYWFWRKGGRKWQFSTGRFILRLLILWDIKSQIANVVHDRNIAEVSHPNKRDASLTHRPFLYS